MSTQIKDSYKLWTFAICVKLQCVSLALKDILFNKHFLHHNPFYQQTVKNTLKNKNEKYICYNRQYET